ncbi:MAG: hypothetical protein GEU82_02735 [Luteitalea sp.]|nr:hypothetical protein [Luteitalea sp.]
MPTKDGDVVIWHRDAALTDYQVWIVTADGQQEPETALLRTVRVPDRSAAEQVALRMVSEGGSILLRELKSGHWTKITG